MAVEMPVDKVEEILKLGQEPVSLEAPVGGGEDDAASSATSSQDDAADRPDEQVAKRMRDADVQRGARDAPVPRAPRDRAALRPRPEPAR